VEGFFLLGEHEPDHVASGVGGEHETASRNGCNANVFNQLLGDRFGNAVKRLTASIFLVTRNLSDGFRLFSTGLVLAAFLARIATIQTLAAKMLPFLAPNIALLVFSVVVMGVATIIYTYLGGMSAVIWTDGLQLIIYLIGLFVAMWLLAGDIPGGLNTVFAEGQKADKFRLFDFSFDLTKNYTFWSGLIGGAFLTTSTHGTDQLLVQRYLCTDRLSRARTALLTEGVAIFIQFVLFLFIGTMLWVFYNGPAASELALITTNGKIANDGVFPQYIVNHLPSGVVGLVVAAVFSAAMSTLSSSLNSSAATAMADFYIPISGGTRGDAHYLKVSRYLTAFWGLVQIGFACLAVKISSSVVNEVLAIAAFPNGLILGVFFLGTFTRRVTSAHAFAGLLAGAAAMLAVKFGTAISWQWYVLIGSLTTFLVGVAVSYLAPSDQKQ
jgi:solute:Na+ symporter, SSS family